MQTITVTTTDLVSVQEAARLLGRPRVTIYRWLSKGKIGSVRFGGIIYIPASEVERFKRQGKGVIL